MDKVAGMFMMMQLEMVFHNVYVIDCLFLVYSIAVCGTRFFGSYLLQ